MEFASSAPALAAGFLLVAVVARWQEGCRCRRRTAARPPPTPGCRPRPTAWLGGSVVDRRAHPVPEARVLAFALARRTRGAPFETATDLDGHFGIAHLPPGTYRLLVEAAGFPDGREVAVTAPADGAAVRRRRRGALDRRSGDARRALPSRARGCCWRRRPAGRCARRSTRAGGGFAFGGLGAGSYAVRAVGAPTRPRRPRAAIEAGDGPAAARRPARAGAGPRRRRARRRRRRRGARRRRRPDRERHAARRATIRCRRWSQSDRAGALRARPLSPGGYRLTASRAGPRPAPGADRRRSRPPARPRRPSRWCSSWCAARACSGRVRRSARRRRRRARACAAWRARWRI